MPGKKGFAALDPAERKKISSLGGKAAHRAGTAHEFTTDEARRAGQKGGLAARKEAEKKEPANLPLGMSPYGTSD